MDPTTQAHIHHDDLATAPSTTGDGIPVLTVRSSDLAATGRSPVAAYQLGENRFSEPKAAGFLQPAHDDLPSTGSTGGFGETSQHSTSGAGQSADTARQTTQDVAESTRQSVDDAAHAAGETAQKAAQATPETAQGAAQATQETAQDAAQATRETAKNAAASTRQTASTVSQSAQKTAQSVAESTRQTTQAAVTGLRKRVNSLSTSLENVGDHPALQEVRGAAQKQVGQLRHTLGRSPTIVDLEKRTGIDRVFLVVGGVLLYFLLIPLNLFGLALPTTTLLTVLPSTFLALQVLESPDSNDNDKFKALLAYFVVLGFVQFLESLAAGLLAKTIPQYYTVKLVFLAYLLHPRTRGALKLHETVFRPILQRANARAPTSTPPTASSASASSSPSQNPSAFTNHASSGTSNPFSGQTGSAGSQTSSDRPYFPSGQEQAIAQLIARDLKAFSAENAGTTHLPSGPGTGVGMEVPKY